MPKTNYIDIMEKNHMEIPWHDYTNADSNALISDADLIEKASVIGRVGLIMLSCGTGAWRVQAFPGKGAAAVPGLPARSVRYPVNLRLYVKFCYLS